MCETRGDECVGQALSRAGRPGTNGRGPGGGEGGGKGRDGVARRERGWRLRAWRRARCVVRVRALDDCIGSCAFWGVVRRSECQRWTRLHVAELTGELTVGKRGSCAIVCKLIVDWMADSEDGGTGFEHGTYSGASKLKKGVHVWSKTF